LTRTPQPSHDRFAMDTPPPITPQPVLPPSEAQARTWSMLAHLSAFLGYVIPVAGWIIGPLLVWQIKKHDMPAIIPHAKEVINFQISCLIYFAVAALFIVIFIGFPLMIAIGVFNLVCVIIAALKANDGILWKYPLSIRFLK
jgi:uncharacterized Tic20 family protein